MPNLSKLPRNLPFMAIVVMVLVLGAMLMMPRSVDNMQHPMVGKPLPNFSVPLLGGEPGELFLPVLWKGQVAVINVFSSWCQPCKLEHPLLGKLRAQGVPVYGIAWRDTAQNITNYLQQAGNPFNAAGLDSSGETTLVLGVGGLPETMLIDKAGYVRWKHGGMLDEEILNKQLLPLYQKYNAQ